MVGKIQFYEITSIQGTRDFVVRNCKIWCFAPFLFWGGKRLSYSNMWPVCGDALNFSGTKIRRHWLSGIWCFNRMEPSHTHSEEMNGSFERVVSMTFDVLRDDIWSPHYDYFLSGYMTAELWKHQWRIKRSFRDKVRNTTGNDYANDVNFRNPLNVCMTNRYHELFDLKHLFLLSHIKFGLCFYCTKHIAILWSYLVFICHYVSLILYVLIWQSYIREKEIEHKTVCARGSYVQYRTLLQNHNINLK